MLPEVVYSIDSFVALNRKDGRYLIYFQGEVYEQRICEFLHTFSFISGVDIEKYLLNTNNEYDFVQVPLSASGQSATLELRDFLNFRELYLEEMYRLRLENMLNYCGISAPLYNAQ